MHTEFETFLQTTYTILANYINTPDSHKYKEDKEQITKKIKEEKWAFPEKLEFDNNYTMIVSWRNGKLVRTQHVDDIVFMVDNNSVQENIFYDVLEGKKYMPKDTFLNLCKRWGMAITEKEEETEFTYGGIGVDFKCVIKNTDLAFIDTCVTNFQYVYDWLTSHGK